MLELTGPAKISKVKIGLPGSKSICNRLLILNEIPGVELSIHNLSHAEDCVLMQQAISKVHSENPAKLDIRQSGTCMRFLTAFLAQREGDWLISGSDRMTQRPVEALVSALKSLGAEITYAGRHGFPPLKIRGKTIAGGKVNIDGSQSSQFISALLLIAPFLEKGLEIEFGNDAVSSAYIKLTAELMSEVGIPVHKTSKGYVVPSFNGTVRKELRAESDWSAASYWYSICALSRDSEIELQWLNTHSFQPDSVLPLIYEMLGVETSFTGESIILKSTGRRHRDFRYKFAECPDIAQTVAVTCLGLGIEAELTGLGTLSIKETDRISALKTELGKCGASVTASDSSISIVPQNMQRPATGNLQIETYGDHRMAMSFAPLAFCGRRLLFSDPDVVNKSYPRFWHDLQSAGFAVNLRP